MSLMLSRRLRRTPYTARAEAAGVSGFTVVNHMLLPKSYRHSVEEDYWHLREAVQLWDVSCQRQIEITGPDAMRLVQLMTPRELSGARPGRCLYVPLTGPDGGLINDPVLVVTDGALRLSIADSDVGLWAEGLAVGRGLDARVREADIACLAVQGPRAEDTLAALFGDEIRALGFFRHMRVAFGGASHVLARSGYSRQGGFEIYLEGAERGPALWDAVTEAGRPFDIRPGCPNLPERIEGGLLSYGSDMTRADTPLEMGLPCDLASGHEFIGRAALEERGPPLRHVAGLRIEGRAPPCAAPWPVRSGGEAAGHATSAAWSPRLDRTVAIATLGLAHLAPGTRVTVETPDGEREAEVSALPMA